MLDVIKSKRGLKLYDPNIRSSVGDLLFECIEICDILRMSSDDYEVIASHYKFSS